MHVTGYRLGHPPLGFELSLYAAICVVLYIGALVSGWWIGDLLLIMSVLFLIAGVLFVAFALATLVMLIVVEAICNGRYAYEHRVSTQQLEEATLAWEGFTPRP
jgi:hypothetical protein